MVVSCLNGCKGWFVDINPGGPKSGGGFQVVIQTSEQSTG